MADEGGVRGTAEMERQAAQGLALFAKEEAAELDNEAATKFKDEADERINLLEEEAQALTGKDNKKARAEKSKEAAALKTTKEYIDALKVLKGLQPPNGNFVKTAVVKIEAKGAEEKASEEATTSPDAKKKAEKKEPKKEESAGISREEKDELEKLKNQIIERKAQLKETGMSGGQINKDPEIVAGVARMNELKEKECPGAVQAAKDEGKKAKKKPLDSDTMKMVEEKQRALDEYAEKLRTEFKYSKKEIAADPDYIEMKDAIAKQQK